MRLEVSQLTMVNCSQAKIGDRLVEGQVDAPRFKGRDIAELSIVIEQRGAA